MNEIIVNTTLGNLHYDLECFEHFHIILYLILIWFDRQIIIETMEFYKNKMQYNPPNHFRIKQD
jgi:hypothetical protein